VHAEFGGERLPLEYLGRSIIARQAGDVIELQQAEVDHLARRGALLPLTEHVQDLRPPVETFAWAQGRWREGDGEQYGVPWAARPELLLWNRTTFRRREAELRAAGVSYWPPRTWDEIVKTAKALTVDTDGDGRPEEFGFALAGKSGPEFGHYYSIFVAQLGGTLVERAEGRWVFDSDQERGRRALRFILDLKKAAPPESIVSDPGDALRQFHSGRAAMVIAGPEGLFPYPGSHVKASEIGVADLPAPAGLRARSCVELRYLAISAYVRGSRREAALEVLRFAAGLSGQRIVAEGVDGVRPLVPVRAAEVRGSPFRVDTTLQPFVNALRHPVPPLPAFLWRGKCSKDWIRALHLPLLFDHQSVDEAVERSYRRGNVAISCLESDIGHPSVTMTLGMAVVGMLVFVVVAYAVSRR
jgi:multiple sugar transport system substrate-binding protein